MKSVLSLCLVFFALTRFAGAHAFAPPSLDTVANSDAVYLVKVGPVQNPQGRPIIFAVTEVWKGQPRASLVLNPYAFDFKENTEWIIFHHPGGFPNGIGWAIKGDCEWLPISVTGDGDKATARWLGPLDQAREYLRQHPHQP